MSDALTSKRLIGVLSLMAAVVVLATLGSLSIGELAPSACQLLPLLVTLLALTLPQLLQRRGAGEL